MPDLPPAGRRHLLLLWAALLTGSPAWSQDQGAWEVKKKRNGISVATRPQADLAFDATRAETVLQVPPEAVFALIWDVERYPEWVPHADQVEVLEAKGQRALTYYLQTDVPWPATDRDGIYRIATRRVGDTLLAEFHCVPDRLPPQEDYIRMPECDGRWAVLPIQENEVRVIYEMRSDMGGSLPGWLANMGSTSVPFNMFKALRKRTAWTKYREADFELP